MRSYTKKRKVTILSTAYFNCADYCTEEFMFITMPDDRCIMI